MHCSNCGAPIEEGVERCPHCGQELIVANKPYEDVSSVSARKEEKVPKSSKGKMIAVVVILFLISIVGSFFIGKSTCQVCSNQEVDKTEDKTEDKETVPSTSKTYQKINLEHLEIKAEDSNDYSKNIKIEGVFHNPKGSFASTIFVYGKNNNSKASYVSLSFYYYDANGAQVGKDTVSRMVNANSSFVIDISPIKDDSFSYQSVKLGYSAKKNPSYNVEISPKDVILKDAIADKESYDGGHVAVSITNQSKIKKIRVFLGCVYYKNKKPVFADVSSYNDVENTLPKQVSFFKSVLELESYDPKKEYKTIEYDDYQVFLMSSYYQDTENYQ